jgi:hypothetical protein
MMNANQGISVYMDKSRKLVMCEICEERGVFGNIVVRGVEIVVSVHGEIECDGGDKWDGAVFMACTERRGDGPRMERRRILRLLCLLRNTRDWERREGERRNV